MKLEKAAKGNRLPILLSITPGVVLFAVFYLIAMGSLAATAFTDWSVRGAEFVSVDNFIAFLSDHRFWLAARNTVFFVAVAVFVQVPIATAVALILSRRIRGWKAIRTVLFLPNMMSGAALGLVFTFVFNPRFGLLNGSLRALGLDSLARDWLSQSQTALFAVAATWALLIGLFVILILAEIHSLPPEFGEAAQLDGAGGWRRDLAITIPLVRPVIATCMLLAALSALAQFDLVFVMTGGGPADQTMTLGLYSYGHYLRGDWGQANAVGLFILVVGVLIILVIRRLGRLEESDR